MKVNVDLGARSYDIIIAPGLINSLPKWLKDYHLDADRGLMVSDSHVNELYGADAQRALAAAGMTYPASIVPAGEESKSGKWLFRIYDDAIAAGLDRKSVVVALGGGVVGDLAGYAAASYMRGLRFVQVPTTLLAMVDSAVGGKTGINLPQGKNLIGAFHQPSLVLCDLNALTSLPGREFRAGLAEVIKYGIIYDASLFDLIEQEMSGILDGDVDLMERIIGRSCEIKADVVRQDETESGLRAILNFGHTMGHAIEAVAGYGTYLHGEAISIGMVYAARLSVHLSGLSSADAERIEALFLKAGLPVKAPSLSWMELKKAMSIDKKSAKGTPRFVLARKIGEVQFGVPVEEKLLMDVWASL